jgi:hypothetical protein
MIREEFFPTTVFMVKIYKLDNAKLAQDIVRLCLIKIK